MKKVQLLDVDDTAISPITSAQTVYRSDGETTVESSLTTMSENLTKDDVTFHFDCQDGVYGWNESAERGADTFHPFKGLVTKSFSAPLSKVNVDLGFRPSMLIIHTNHNWQFAWSNVASNRYCVFPDVSTATGAYSFNVGDSYLTSINDNGFSFTNQSGSGFTECVAYAYA